MRKLLIASLATAFAIGIAAPALASPGHYDRSDNRHERVHDRLEDRHDGGHDRLENAHDRAHDYRLSRREHRRLHRSLDRRHERQHDRLENRHDRFHDRSSGYGWNRDRDRHDD